MNLYIRDMKVGLFFGSFNPIHVGHLILANYMIEETDLDQVWFVVSPQSPHKNKSSLLNEYQVKDIRIKHYDLFRINRKEDINNLDIFEKDHKLITFIEWQQLIADKQDIKFITLTFIMNQLLTL